jgi:3'(2'), 5'-bisphosphate nucleotidase
VIGHSLIHPTADLLERVAHIALMAGEAILNIYNQDFEVSLKEDLSPLTIADKKAHEVITAELQKLDMNIDIISEEGTTEIVTNAEVNKYWLVDPLDGTKEFINRNGEFSVNISLIESNQPVLGVIYAPVLGLLYKASSGLGAYKHDIVNNSCRQIHVNNKIDQFKVVGSRSHGNDFIDAFISKIDAIELISIGSSLKFCMVAEGGADIYPRFGPTSHWDTAAAQCILEEAGGSVRDLDGHKLLYPYTQNKLNPFFVASGISNCVDLTQPLKLIKPLL